MYQGFGIHSGVKVLEDEAWDYVLCHLNELSQNERQALVEWFFSDSFFVSEEHGCDGEGG